MLVATKEGEVEQERFVAPLGNISKGGISLVSERLAPGWRFAPLKKEPRGEDPLRLQPGEVDWLNPCQLVN
jgi:hypothetical protein